MKFFSRLVPTVTYVLISFLAATQSPVTDKEWNPKATVSGFVENKSRLRTTDYIVNDELLFKLPGASIDLYVTTTGLSYVFHKLKTNKILHGPVANSNTQKRLFKAVDAADAGILHYEVERVDMTLKNAHINREQATVSYAAAGASLRNYINSANAEVEKSINAITFHEIYPGIDWKIYIKEDAVGQPVVKYDFMISAGADTRLLQWKYSPNVKVVADDSGTVKVKGKLCNFEEGKLLVYEKSSGAPIPAKVHLKGHTLQYGFAEPIMQKDIVVDPVLFWGTYLTGVTAGIYYNDVVSGSDLTTDAAGNIYVQLNVSSNVDFPTLNPGGGAYYQDVAASPNGGMAIMKFNRQGVLLWSTLFGSGGGMRICVDGSGYVYTAGVAYGGTLPLKNNGGYFSSTAAYTFMARFTPSGALDWSTYWLGQDWVATDMKADVSGNVFITGKSSFYSQPVINPGGGAYMETAQYVLRPFIMKLSPACNIVWSTQINGADEYTGPARLTFDNNNNLVLGVDSVLKFNASLQLVADFGAGYLADLVVDSHGNLFVVGGGESAAGFPYTDPGGGAFMDNSAGVGKSTGYIMKFNPGNQLVWATTLINNEQTFMERIVLDKTCDAVQVLGIMNDASYQYPTFDNTCTGDFYYPAGSSPIATGPILMTFKTTGQQVYTSLTDFPYEYYDYGAGFAIDPFGSLIYLFGDMRNFSTISAVKDPGAGTFFQPTRNNLFTASFLMKLNPSPMQATIQVTNPTGCTCDGTASINITCGTAPYTYTWSNGATTASVNGLCNGDYTVHVVDNFCKDTVFHFTIAPGPGSVTGFTNTAVPAHCNQADGSISIADVTGGTAPFTYALNNSAFQSTPQFAALAPGMYLVQVKDQFGCPFKDSLLVPNIPGPDSIYISVFASSCNQNNGSITIDSVRNGVSPYTFSIDQSTSQSLNKFTALAAGTYALNATDAFGCTVNRQAQIVKALPPSADQHTSSSAHCKQADGSITVNAVTGGSAPFQYSLDGINYRTGPGFDSLVSGQYNLYVQDNSGCIFTDTATVQETPGPDSIGLILQNAICDAPFGSVKISGVRGGAGTYLYRLDSLPLQNNNYFTSVAPGSHSLSVQDAYGCAVDSAFIITATHKTPLLIVPKDTMVCYGNSVSLFATAADGSSFQSIDWNNGQGIRPTFTVTVFQSTTVQVSATNAAGCVSMDTATVDMKNCDSTASYCLIFPNAFTPNSDGKNDLFGPVVHCLLSQYHLQIFNRYGELVFSSTDNRQKWDGYFAGQLQEIGAYVYLCSYTIGAVTKSARGTVLLVR